MIKQGKRTTIEISEEADPFQKYTCGWSGYRVRVTHRISVAQESNVTRK
jgi:hypothetical protein